MKNDINENPALGKTAVRQSVIKPNELRIGNIIKLIHGEKEFNFVKGVDEETVFIDEITFDYTSFDEFEPIQLTKEWFEKLGFTYYSLPTRSGRKIGYYTLKYGSKFKIGGSDNNYAFSNFRKPLQYVHELQNLCFALTDIELTVA